MSETYELYVTENKESGVVSAELRAGPEEDSGVTVYQQVRGAGEWLRQGPELGDVEDENLFDAVRELVTNANETSPEPDVEVEGSGEEITL